ncbi:tRNA (cytidine(34)-2'-O)-methyltransferase [beta proteobacterium MWH-UniP1]
MFNVVLFEPEIPPNTGNVIRLCANTGARLHLIEPLGFPIDHAKMRRAGLDYHELTLFKTHRDWQAFLNDERPDPDRLFAITTKGQRRLGDVGFQKNDWFVFGSETKGLGPLLDTFAPEQRIRIPLAPNNRSLNLSNSVAIVVFDAWRQLHFEGGA